MGAEELNVWRRNAWFASVVVVSPMRGARERVRVPTWTAAAAEVANGWSPKRGPEHLDTPIPDTWD